MKILVTGAAGFVGRNLSWSLKSVMDGKDRTRGVCVEKLWLYDVGTDKEILREGCREADFVIHLAGVNRPKDASEFMEGNFGFSSELLSLLSEHGNKCPVLLSSSIQATLIGRYDGEYGRSKRAGEELFFEHEKTAGARVLVYRYPNLFGKWARPNYNSAVATFCNNIANDLPITVSDPKIELELLYIDDLIDEIYCALRGEEHRCEFDGLSVVPTAGGRYCYSPVTHRVTLGEIVSLLESFGEQPKTLVMPENPAGSFAAKLYATYLSYLPADKVAIPLNMHVDARGSFTELMRSEKCGQFSVNVSLPGITKGEHWHNTKWEFFIVVSGKGRIEQRQIDSGEVLSFDVSGERIEAIHILPGYTHNIINLSDTEPLVTLMWANECFNPDKPDTFGESVHK